MPGVNIIARKRRWGGYILSGLITLFLLMDGIMKLFKPAVVVQSTRQLGYAESTIVGIGMILLGCTLLYIIPRTAVLGAVLLTAYLGGAVASNFRAAMSPFNVLFPTVLGGLIWAGLWLQDKRVEELLPLRSGLSSPTSMDCPAVSAAARDSGNSAGPVDSAPVRSSN